MSAYITPPSGWIDLRSVAANPVTIATGLGLGLHSYSHDVAINDLLIPANDAELLPTGLNVLNPGNSGGMAAIHKASCSAALAPTFEFIARIDSTGVGRIGVAAERVCDDSTLILNYLNMEVGCYILSALGTVNLVERTSVINTGNVGALTNEWVRIVFTSVVQGNLKVYLLASGDPVDWDGGTLLTDYNYTGTVLSGGSVLTPMFSSTAGSGDTLLAAVRVTPRRTL